MPVDYGDWNTCMGDSTEMFGLYIYTEKNVSELSLVSSRWIITACARSDNPDSAPVISLVHQEITSARQEYFGLIGRIITGRACSNNPATADQ